MEGIKWYYCFNTVLFEAGSCNVVFLLADGILPGGKGRGGICDGKSCKLESFFFLVCFGYFKLRIDMIDFCWFF